MNTGESKGEVDSINLPPNELLFSANDLSASYFLHSKGWMVELSWSIVHRAQTIQREPVEWHDFHFLNSSKFVSGISVSGPVY